MATKLVIKVEDYDNGGYKHLLVDAVMLPLISGIPHFVARNPIPTGAYWLIVEYTTGLHASYGWTIGSAMTVAEANINTIGVEAYQAKLTGVIAEFGQANVDPAPDAEGKIFRDIEKELTELYLAEHPLPTEPLRN